MAPAESEPLQPRRQTAATLDHARPRPEPSVALKAVPEPGPSRLHPSLRSPSVISIDRDEDSASHAPRQPPSVISISDDDDDSSPHAHHHHPLAPKVDEAGLNVEDEDEEEDEIDIATLVRYILPEQVVQRAREVCLF